MKLSITEIERLADQSQRRADRMRIDEVNRRDDRPWFVGLALLSCLGMLVVIGAVWSILT